MDMTVDEAGESRRDFLYLTAAAFGAVGAGSVAWPLVDQMNPAADTLALASTEVDLSPIETGQAITVMWRGKPVFVRRRTEKEIKQAQDVDIATLRDKQADSDRVQKSQWLVTVGICTHLGCVPLGQKSTDQGGILAAGFVRATAPTMIRPGAFARGLPRKICKCRSMCFWTRQPSGLGKGA